MHCKFVAACFLAALLGSQTAIADEDESTPDALAKLGPLGVHGPELRIWITDALTQTEWGFVVSTGKVERCVITWKYSRSKSTLRTAQCKRPTDFKRSAEALGLLDQLSLLNGKDIDCGVEDGSYVSIEGFQSNGVFAFAAGNPQWCQDSGSILVTKLLSIPGLQR